MSTTLRTEEIRDFEALERLAPHWSALAERSPHDTPHVLPDFLLPWLSRMRDRVEPRVLAVWQDDVLVGLAPMAMRLAQRFGVSVRVLGFAEEVPSPPCDLLVDPASGSVLEACFEHWRKAGGWDLLSLVNLPEESLTLSGVEALARTSGLGLVRSPGLETYFVPVRETWELFHAGRSYNLRRNLRRGFRACERLGTATYRRYPGDLDFGQARMALFDVLARSWKDHEDGPSGWNTFLRGLVDRLQATGRLQLRLLFIASSPVAYLLETVFKGVPYALHNGYDLHYQACNPGQLLIEDALREAHRNGAPRYDFTGHRTYLRQWTHTTRRFHTLRVFPRGLAGRAKSRLWLALREHREHRLLSATDSAKDNKKRRFKEAS